VAAKMQLRKDFEKNYGLRKIRVSPQKNFFAFKRTGD